MSTINPTERDDPGTPLRSTAELVDFFRSAEKPFEKFRVGTEHEKFGFVRAEPHRHYRHKNLVERLPPLPYEGPDGIEALLIAIANDPAERNADGSARWTPATDNGRVIALFGTGHPGASITLEPGGQLELSGEPFKTVHETATETTSHLALLRRHCLERGIGFVGMGFHPTATWAEMPTVPKSRYVIMQRYMPTVGKRGLDMMKRTATVQANYDWKDETDMVKGFQMSLAVSPLVAALFASSPFYEGRPSGSLSERQQVWADTDPNRAGFPDVVFAKDFSYAKYVDWLLDVPMYFVRRDGIHHDVAGASFRDFVKDGLVVDGVNVRATERDFADHLTTTFPEVRVKKVLEVRSADCGAWSRICALPALYKGLLYDEAAREGALALLPQPKPGELAELRRQIAVLGYRASWRGQPVLGLCQQLVALSRDGLHRLGAKNSRGDDESIFLEPLQKSLDEGRTFAERLLDLYKNAWGGSLAPLWDEVEFWPDED